MILHGSMKECSELGTTLDMGSCQNYGPFLGTLNIRCRIIIRDPKGTIIWTTTHFSRGIML